MIPRGPSPYWIDTVDGNQKSGQKTSWETGSLSHYLQPLDPKTMKNEGFEPPIYGL